MAVRTIYELYDILHGSESNYGITATDKEETTQTVITSSDAKRYFMRKYAERRYQVLGGSPLTAAEAEVDFHEDFTLWIKNRQHNIDRMYQALFDYDYSPIENVDRYENESTTTDDNVSYGKTSTDSGTDSTTYGKVLTDSGTDSTTYGKTLTDSGTDTTTYGKVMTDSGTDTTTYGKVETNSGRDTDTLSGSDTVTKNGDHITTTEKAGFNAPNAFTNSERVTDGYDEYEEATTYGKTDTFQHGKTTTNSGTDSLAHGLIETASGSDSLAHGKVETASGSDSLTHGKVETASGSDSVTYGKKNTEGGKDERDITVGRTLRVHGNIGVTTNNQLIEEELNMRMKSLAEMLLDNFINDYTYYS